MKADKSVATVLRDRVRVEPSESSVEGSLPVLFFGDALSARVATIGLNPSKYEYLDRSGGLLSGERRRFATLPSLGAPSRASLTVAQASEAIDVMRAYYDEGKPVYGSYFRHLTNFLTGFGAGYSERTATHLDLVQEATDPVWNQLPPDEQARLLARDLPFLAWELEHFPRLRAVICAGATVSRELQRRVHVEIAETGTSKRLRWWLGTARAGRRELPIGGWNYPLDRPTGLGTAGEIALGRAFAASLL